MQSPLQYFRFVFAPAALFHDVGRVDTHCFEMQRCCRYSDDGIFDDIHDLAVLNDVVYQAGGSLRSDGQWETLQALEEILPLSHVPRHAEETPEAADAAAYVDLQPWMAYPAMWEFLKMMWTPRRRG